MRGNLVRSSAYLAGCVVFLICLVVCPKVEAQIDIDSTDWEGLKALYISTRGAEWDSTWNLDTTSVEPPSQESVDNWYGVTPEDGRVTELNLPGNGLFGKLPDELGNLSELRILNLQNNRLSDSIGAWIGDLTALEKLYLQNNDLAGAIPDELGNLSELEVLDISGNRLEGVVPDRLTNLKNLWELWLYNNLLSGSIPEGLIELPKLHSLRLGQNLNLSGVISVKDPTQVPFIDLKETSLCIDQTNTDLDEVSEQIQTFHEYACLPAKEWTALEELYNSTKGETWTNKFGWNFGTRLRGSSVGQWYGVSVEAGSIRSLKLEGNNLKGHLPAELGFLTNLEVLHLGDNLVRGAIPKELTSLENLKEFSAFDTRLCEPNTTKVQSWLNGIQLVSRIRPCIVGSTVASPILWLVIGLGLLGTGAVLLILLTQTARSKELDPVNGKLIAISQQLETLIQSLRKQSEKQDDNVAEFKSKLENLHSDLAELDQDFRDLKETVQLGPVEDKLVAIEKQLEIMIPDLDQHFDNQNNTAGRLKSAMENLHSTLTELVQDIKNFKETVQLGPIEDKLVAIGRQLQVFISEISKNGAGGTNDVSPLLDDLRRVLNEQEDDIKRLKRGYDNVILRKFVTRFARVDQAVRYFLQRTEVSATSFEQIHSLLESALQECDVQSFNPEIGSDYRDRSFRRRLTDQPKILPTSVRENDYKIANILEPGYIMQGVEEETVLIPARVSVYRYET